MEQEISADRLEDWYRFNETIKLNFQNASYLFILILSIDNSSTIRNNTQDELPFHKLLA